MFFLELPLAFPLVFFAAVFLGAVLLPAVVCREAREGLFAPRRELALVFLFGVFLAVLLLGVVVRREERDEVFGLWFAGEDFVLGALTRLFAGRPELALLRRDVAVERFFDRLRISPTTAPTSPAPATASIGFSFTADAAFFVPFVPDDAALPTRVPLRATA
jgi:hypothetical protein